MNTAAGVGALVGNGLIYGRMVADVTQVNPMRGATAIAVTIGRGGEAVKEAHLKSHEVIDKGRVQDENEAYEEAMALYGQAKAKSPDGKVSAENLSKIYKENLPKDLLNRLDKNQDKDGICSRIAQKVAKSDIEFSLKRIDKKIKNIENDDNLSPGEKAAAKGKVLKKYEKFLHDMDRLVANSGRVDMLAYGSRIAEKGGKVAAGVMALETLAEGIAHGEAALATLSAGESDSSLELPFQESGIELDENNLSLEDEIIADSAPVETSAETIIPENIEPAEPAEQVLGESPAGESDWSAEKSAAFAKDLHEGGVSTDEQYAGANAKILENSGVEAEDLSNLNQEDLKNLSPEQIGQIDDYNQKIEALKNAGISQEDIDKLAVEDVQNLSDEEIKNIAAENVGASSAETATPQNVEHSVSDQASQIDSGEEEIIGNEGETVANEYSKETSYEGKSSDVQEPVVDANIPSASEVFGRKFISMENLQKIAREKGMSEQTLRDEATDAGIEIRRYVDMYKSLINSGGKSEKTDGILKKITETTTRYESKYGSGFLDKASILENLKK